jgi:hypothetical protein
MILTMDSKLVATPYLLGMVPIVSIQGLLGQIYIFESGTRALRLESSILLGPAVRMSILS